MPCAPGRDLGPRGQRHDPEPMIRHLTLFLVVTLLVIRAAAPIAGPAAAQGCGGGVMAAEICPVPGLPAAPRGDTSGPCQACVLPALALPEPVLPEASHLVVALAEQPGDGLSPLPDRRPPRA